jgi:hypothetical protein
MLVEQERSCFADLPRHNSLLLPLPSGSPAPLVSLFERKPVVYRLGESYLLPWPFPLESEHLANFNYALDLTIPVAT